MQETYDESVFELDEEECWEFLRSHELGRLAFTTVDELHIVPINYAVDDRTLLFRTAPGEKLLSVVLGKPVAFEVDEITEDDRARSVVLRGTMRLLEEDEAHRAEVVPLRPWVATEKFNVVEIAPQVVTGRAFQLGRPWLRMLPPEE